MVGVDERSLHGKFSLHYVFAFDDYGFFLTLKSYVTEEDPTFPSVTKELPVCDWYEREVYDLLGLKPEGHPNLHRLILHKDWPDHTYPLRKDYPLEKMQAFEQSQEWFSTTYEGEGVTRVPVGPIHAGIIEPGHFQFGVAGDVILHLDAQLFFKHRGLEKRSEGMSLEKGLLLAERICGMCSLSHAVSYAQAVEQLAQVTIPKRAKYLRMIFLEMERLYNHIGDIGDICSGAGFHFGTTHGARLKEELQQLNEKITGHRFLRGLISLCGVRRDIAEHEFLFLQTRLEKIHARQYPGEHRLKKSLHVKNDDPLFFHSTVVILLSIEPRASYQNENQHQNKYLQYPRYDCIVVPSLKRSFVNTLHVLESLLELIVQPLVRKKQHGIKNTFRKSVPLTITPFLKTSLHFFFLVLGV